MTKSLKIIFAGTPEFATTTLQALIDSNHNIVAVYTQPDRPAGRGRKLKPSPVKGLALEYHIPLEQPSSLKEAKAQERLRTYHADMMIVVAYGLLLPEAVLESFPLGCINIHASLLPRWRGAAPIQRALLAGDKETGIAIMQLTKGLDTGPVIAMEKVPIEKGDTSAILHDKLAKLGATTLIKTLPKIVTGESIPKEQNHDQATYAYKIKKEEAKINWSDTADKIDRMIRTFNSWPIAFTSLEKRIVRIWQCAVLPEESEKLPGTILRTEPAGIDVATGCGIIRLLTLQFPGGKPLSARDILNSKSELIKPGVIFR